MGALLLAIIAGVVPVFPFSIGETVYAQERPDDATLAADGGLTLTGATLTPEYMADITEYTARVANSVNVVTVTASTNNEDATLRIRPGGSDTPTMDTQNVALPAGRHTTITVKVTAEDRRTTETYTITVYRDRSAQSDNANLSALSLDGVSLSPRFSSGTTAYNARVRYDVTTVTVAATAADIGALPPDVTADGGNTVTNNSVVALGAVDTNTAITVTVTAEDDTTTKPYIITVFRESGPVLSDVATLTSLTLTGATLSPSPFVGSTNEYTARATNDQESVTIAAPASDTPGAMVVIRPPDQNTADETDAEGHQVYLTPGTNTVITITVTAENGSTNTYTVTVYRVGNTPSDNGNLSALSLDGVSLSPAFDPETAAYDARVSYDVTMVTVAAAAADIGALAPDVTAAGGNTVTNNSVVALGDVGTETVITVTVTAEDTSTNPYTITVYRESGPVLDDDATLTTLTALPSTLALVAGTTEYMVSVENNQAFVTVVATPTDTLGAMVDIMPADQNTLPEPEGHQVYLTAGARTTITIIVTAENGSTNTYTVMAYRKRATESSDSTLSALSLDGLSLSAAFDPETTAYDARVRYDVSEVTVEHTVTDIAASGVVTIDAGDAAGASVANNKVVTLGTAQGENTVITITVMAENDGTTPYTITVYRENIVLSDIATLVATGPGALSLGDDITLLPTPFVASTNEYTARATNTAEFATVTATPTDDPGAMVDIMPADRDSLTEGHQVYLASGANTEITITVTAEDGSTNTYTFMVYRIRADESTDATLSDLSLSGAVLAPVFDPERGTYTATATYTTDITTVTAPANDIGAISRVIMPADSDTVTPGHQVPLSDRGATTITVIVTPESGTDDNKTYTITVYRDAEASSDATLQTLSLSGLTLMPAFDAATTAYTAEVEMLETTMVEAMATHPGAMVQGAGAKTLTAGENTISVTVMAEDGTTSQTYTVTVTVLDMVTPEGTLLDRYDADDSDHIDLSEVNTAIDDYFDGELTLAEVNAVIDLFFQ